MCGNVVLNLWGTLPRDFVRVCVCVRVCEFVRQKGLVRIDQQGMMSIFLQIFDRYGQN